MLLCNYSFLVLSMVLLAQAVAHVVYIITAHSAVSTDLQRGEASGAIFIYSNINMWFLPRLWILRIFDIHTACASTFRISNITQIFRVIISTDDDWILIVIWTKFQFFFFGLFPLLSAWDNDKGQDDTKVQIVKKLFCW